MTGENYWVTFNSALTIFLLAVFTLFPIFSALFMYLNFDRLALREIIEKYGEMYAGYKL